MADKELSFKIKVDGVSTENQELAKLELQLRNIKKERDELIKQATRPGHIASKDEIAALAVYNKQIGEMSSRQRELTKVVGTASDSLERKRAKLAQLKKEYAGASEEAAKRMAPSINKLNSEILKSEQAIGVNQRNVGNYASALQGLPGPIGAATSSVNTFGAALKKLLLNPIVLLIAAIVGALAALFKAFKSTDSGGTEFAARMEQIKAIVDVLRQRLISLTQAIGHIFKGEWKEAGQSFKETFTGIGDQIKDATKAAYAYTQAMDTLTNSEQNYISKSAEVRNAIAKLEFTAQDRTKSTAERRKALQEALRLGEEELNQQKDYAKQRFELEAQYLAEKNGLRKEDVIAFTKMSDEEQANATDALKTLRNNNEEKLVEIENLYAKWLDLDTKFYEENKRNISRLSGFEEEIRNNQIKATEEQKKAEEELLKLKIQNSENAPKRVETQQEAELGILRKYTGLTLEEIAKRNAEVEGLEQTHADAKFRIAVGAANLINGIVGKNKALQKASLIADKALTIAEIIIQTRKANAALRAWGALGGPIGMGIAQAAIIKNNISAGLDIAAVTAAAVAGVIGYAKGGYTKRGRKYEPAGVVHAGEWVAPQEMVNSPVTGPIISALEKRRSSIMGSGVMNRVSGYGYANGGYVAQNMPNIPSMGVDYNAIGRAVRGNIIVINDINKVRSALDELDMINTAQPI